MTTYPPLNVLKPIGDRIWIVDSGPIAAMGIVQLPVRMTVMQLDEGSVALHSPTLYAMRRLGGKSRSSGQSDT